MPDEDRADATSSFARARAPRTPQQRAGTARARFVAASDRLASEGHFDPDLVGASEIEVLEHATALTTTRK